MKVAAPEFPPVSYESRTDRSPLETQVRRANARIIGGRR